VEKETWSNMPLIKTSKEKAREDKRKFIPRCSMEVEV